MLRRGVQHTARLVHPQPLPLAGEDRLLCRAMRQEPVTEEELRSQLRLQGDDDLGRKTADMEGGGRITVVAHEGQSTGTPERPLG